MLKVMALLTRKQGLATRDLIEYYEHHHVPLVAAQAPPPLDYKRNYVVNDSEAPNADFDIVTELVFSDRTAYRAWLACVYAEGSGVAADEMNFLDRSKTRSYVVEEHVGPDPPT
jgi:uncharacterized protein (TIGR02118 family)